MSDIYYIMVVLDSGVVRNSVLMFLGSRELYEYDTSHAQFDSLFGLSGVKSRFVVKALRSRMYDLGLSFDGFVKHVETLFNSLLEVYPFEDRGEYLEGVVLDNVDAVTLHVPHVSWKPSEPNGTADAPAAVLLFTVNSLLECDSRVNFFTELLGNVFNVPLNVREHLLYVAPNFNGLPRVFLETWLFFKNRTHDWTLHDNVECGEIVDSFNKKLNNAYYEVNKSVEDLSRESFRNSINEIYVGVKHYGAYSETTRGGFIRVNHNLLKIGTGVNSNMVVKYFTGSLNVVNIEIALLCTLFLNSSCFPTRNNIDLVLALDAMFALLSDNNTTHGGAHAGRVISESFENFFLTCVEDLTVAFLLEEKLGTKGLTSSEEYGKINVNNFAKMLTRFQSSLTMKQLDTVDDLPEEWVKRI